MKKIILRHLIIWLLLSVLFFFLSEPITKWILPEVHDVTIWLKVLASGLVLIFCALLISVIVAVVKRKKTQAATAN
jgi:hypothetical protein